MSRYYQDEFKEKIAKLALNGKNISEIASEYGISRTTIRNWIKQFDNSGKFGVKINLSDSEIELRNLKKEVKQLKMENDILKQAALILAQKSN